MFTSTPIPAFPLKGKKHVRFFKGDGPFLPFKRDADKHSLPFKALKGRVGMGLMCDRYFFGAYLRIVSSSRFMNATAFAAGMKLFASAYWSLSHAL